MYAHIGISVKNRVFRSFQYFTRQTDFTSSLPVKRNKTLGNQKMYSFVVVKNSLLIKFVIKTLMFFCNFFKGAPLRCVIIQDKQGLNVPLSEWNLTAF